MIHISIDLWAARLYTSACWLAARLLVHLHPHLSISIAGYMMDVERALSTLEESPMPHKDFGFLVVPKRLRYSATHPFYFGTWSRIVFGSGCAFSQCSTTQTERSLTSRSCGESVLLPATPEYVFCIFPAVHFTVSFPQSRCRLISERHTRTYHCERSHVKLSSSDVFLGFLRCTKLGMSCHSLSIDPNLCLRHNRYCIGLMLISPLGDLLRRRQLIMTLVTITTCLSVGLVLSRSLLSFQMFAFLLGVFNVTPQILIPFAADLASPRQREAAVSVLQSGIMLGILLARVAAGIIAYYFQWRVVYYVSIGVQLIVLCGIYLLVPDQSPKNPDLTYLEIFYTMAKYIVTEPRLVQASLINVASVACWSSFWTTLTFFLGGPPYNYPT